ncbi:RNA 2',3'-cyclic phosphodiesterase [Halomonas sp. HK25]|uniref:RNA 2',3'-cyclic phosphodiesterase n=1 Tax=Halomonas sp. HK25 TaxID=3394321 RepID=UPI0039FBFF15
MRLFLALVPPLDLRERLGALADAAHARCGGRRMPDESLHLTLAFLGEVGDEQASELVDWMCRLAVTPGEWRLDAWGHFRRPGIVWVGGQAPDAALGVLHKRLWDALEEFGLAGRPAHFMPHVTLLRRAKRLDASRLPAPDLVWGYNQLDLVQSTIHDRGSRYVSLARSLES